MRHTGDGTTESGGDIILQGNATFEFASKLVLPLLWLFSVLNMSVLDCADRSRRIVNLERSRI